MYLEQFSCDVCGTVKGATNHWFIAYAESALSSSPLSFAAWDADSARDCASLCGQECALVFLQQWMDMQEQQQGAPAEKVEAVQ